MTAAKVTAVVLALFYLFGLAWSAGSVESSTQLLVSITAVCTFIIAFFPRKYIKAGMTISILIGVVFFCTVALIMLLIKDFRRSYGVDAVGVIMNAVFMISIAYLGMEVWEISRKQRRMDSKNQQ